MTRYLIITDFQRGVGGTPIEEWTPDEITAHLDYYRAIHRGLRGKRGARRLRGPAPPDVSKVVTSDGAGKLVTDGPFAEFKEWVAGYQIVDVESEARAIEIAARISAVPGAGGVRPSSRSRSDGSWMRTRRPTPPRSLSYVEHGREPRLNDHAIEAPSAGSGAGGPRDPRAPVRRLRCRGRRDPGGAARGRLALGGRRHPAKSARLAPAHCASPNDQIRFPKRCRPSRS